MHELPNLIFTSLQTQNIIVFVHHPKGVFSLEKEVFNPLFPSTVISERKKKEIDVGDGP